MHLQMSQSSPLSSPSKLDTSTPMKSIRGYFIPCSADKTDPSTTAIDEVTPTIESNKQQGDITRHDALETSTQPVATDLFGPPNTKGTKRVADLTKQGALETTTHPIATDLIEAPNTKVTKRRAATDMVATKTTKRIATSENTDPTATKSTKRPAASKRDEPAARDLVATERTDHTATKSTKRLAATNRDEPAAYESTTHPVASGHSHATTTKCTKNLVVAERTDPIATESTTRVAVVKQIVHTDKTHPDDHTNVTMGTSSANVDVDDLFRPMFSSITDFVRSNTTVLSFRLYTNGEIRGDMDASKLTSMMMSKRSSWGVPPRVTTFGRVGKVQRYQGSMAAYTPFILMTVPKNQRHCELYDDLPDWHWGVTPEYIAECFQGNARAFWETQSAFLMSAGITATLMPGSCLPDQLPTDVAFVFNFDILGNATTKQRTINTWGSYAQFSKAEYSRAPYEWGERLWDSCFVENPTTGAMDFVRSLKFDNLIAKYGSADPRAAICHIEHHILTTLTRGARIIWHYHKHLTNANNQVLRATY